MVGNLVEWVARSTECAGWAELSDDFMCLAGAGDAAGAPGALLRGGSFTGGTSNGPLMVLGTLWPVRSVACVAFRCAL